MAVVVGLYRLALAAITLVALFWAPSSGPYFHLTDFVYFTDQSNLLMAVVMVWGAVAVLGRRRGPQPWLWGAVTLYLLITALVAQFVLDPPAPGAEIIELGLTKVGVVHQLAPIATFVHFLLMVPHRRLRIRVALSWLAYPVAYIAFIVVRGVVSPDSAYPYGFIDVDDIGYGGLLLNILIYGVGFWVLGLVLVGIDRLLPARTLIGPRDEPAPPPTSEPPAGAADPSPRASVDPA
ncbi:Pr6Pr family membrane protein [Cellulomonas alba]|uniref:Pr6Pr family membrane protein n=1 Tax=Cellulomonas alba TaxID=3053467 RepID=A0ABT7SJS5_9CELL|nr:Pr6Pr family membrane protein [Cellulomonas alba]MDM7856436.1 Pr6Pr family membrane protein [Cellulomonas alba]